MSAASSQSSVDLVGIVGLLLLLADGKVSRWSRRVDDCSLWSVSTNVVGELVVLASVHVSSYGFGIRLSWLVLVAHANATTAAPNHLDDPEANDPFPFVNVGSACHGSDILAKLAIAIFGSTVT